ncbi:hypothetical protein [Kordiimonas sp.]|uniref:hypothetical protein n=1 Tax=Kordiimonas sp. TaxID=1970157 RepID=UPI003A910949
MTYLDIDQQEAFERQILGDLFDAFSSRRIRYGILRNFENLPHGIDGTDIDILVHPNDLVATLEEIHKTAWSNVAQFAKSYQDDMITQLVMTKRSTENALLTLKIDVLHNRQVMGIQFLSAEEMLRDLRTHNGVSVVSELVMLIDKWSFHLLLGAPLDAKYAAEFATIAKQQKDAVTGLLERFLPEYRACQLVEALIEGEGATLKLNRRERMHAFLRLWRAQGILAVPRTLRFVYSRIRDALRPDGVFLSISGPDGSGKTTVIDLVSEQLSQIYGQNAVTYAHFRPTVLPRIAEVAKKARAVETIDENYDQPHRAKPSGLLGSSARLAYYWLDYLWGYYRSVLPVLKRRDVMLFDRYYYDMIADGFRSRISLPTPLLLGMGRLLPLPKHAFFISVSPDEIHRRKQELTMERIIALNDRYGDLADRGWLTHIDNNGAPEIAASAIVDHIVADRDTRDRRFKARQNQTK